AFAARCGSVVVTLALTVPLAARGGIHAAVTGNVVSIAAGLLFGAALLRRSIEPEPATFDLRREPKAPPQPLSAAPVPKFSLIICTVDRTEQLSVLLASLDAQTFKDFELLVVDQNADDRVEPMIAAYEGRMTVRRLWSPRGASRARN